MPTVRISRLQFFTIIGNLVYGKAIGYTGQVLARSVTNDAWLAMLLAFAGGMPVMALMVWLASRFPDRTPLTYIPALFGRFLGALLMLGLAVFFFIAFATSAITIEQHINDYLMTETPLIIFVVGYTLICIYAVHLGIEVTARLSVLGFGLLILLDLLMIIGTLDHFVVDRLKPYFDHGVGPVLTASLAAHTDVAMATAGALLLLPLTGDPKRWYRLSLWALGVGGIITAIWTTFEMAVLGPEVTAQYLIACMQLARAAELSIYLHRYELIMVTVFVYGVLTQSIVCLYGACELVAAALPGLRLSRPVLVLLLGALTIPLQYYLAVDRDRYGLFLAGPWPLVAIGLAYGIPALAAVVRLLRPGVGAGAPPAPGGGQRRPPRWEPPPLR